MFVITAEKPVSKNESTKKFLFFLPSIEKYFLYLRYLTNFSDFFFKNLFLILNRDDAEITHFVITIRSEINHVGSSFEL